MAQEIYRISSRADYEEKLQRVGKSVSLAKVFYNGKAIEKEEMKLLLDDVHRYGTKFLQSAWFLLDINEKEVAELADKEKIDFQKLPSVDIYKPATQGLEEMVVRYNDQNYRKNLRTFIINSQEELLDNRQGFSQSRQLWQRYRFYILIWLVLVVYRALSKF